MTYFDRRKVVTLALAAVGFSSLGAMAQSAYPTQSIKIIVPFTPGTGMDTIARVVAPRLSERLGQPVVVQNQPGASGNIGADAVAKANPDGHTLLMGANTMLMAAQMYKNVNFDPVKDYPNGLEHFFIRGYVYFGTPLPGNILKIVDQQSGAVLPTGSTGEICIKGPTLMMSYLGKATERLFLPLLKLIVPDILDYDLPMFGVFHNCAFIKIKKELEAVKRTRGLHRRARLLASHLRRDRYRFVHRPWTVGIQHDLDGGADGLARGFRIDLETTVSFAPSRRTTQFTAPMIPADSPSRSRCSITLTLCTFTANRGRECIVEIPRRSLP